MKRNLIRNLVFLLIAILLSTATVTWHSLSNVSACVQAPGCVDQAKQPLGKLTVRSYGFPATYKQTVIFNPVNNNENSPNYAGYGSATAQTQATSIAKIVINVVFWFALISFGWNLVERFLPKKRTNDLTTHG